MDNYNDKSLMENVKIANENSRKWDLERNENSEVILSFWQIRCQKLTLNNPTQKERNQRKELSIKKTERHDIKGVVTKVNNQVCYIRIIEIFNEREDIEVQKDIRVPNDCVIKLNYYFYYFYILNNLYWY